MKIKILLIAIVTLTGTVTLNAQDKMFEKLSNNNDITTVFISKALLSMAGNMNTGPVNIKALSNKLEGLEIYTSERKGGSNLMQTEIKELARDKTYEVLMAVKEKDENVIFYAKRDNSDKFKDLIMFVNEPNESTIIRIKGSFTMEDIQGVAKQLPINR